MSEQNAGYALADGTDIRALPKVSLHDHLDGGLRPSTVIELGDAVGLELPTTDPVELARWFGEKSNSGSLVEYLKTFDLTTAVMQTREGLTRVAREFVQDLGADGVVYGEIRWAPEQHVNRGLSLDDENTYVTLGTLSQWVKDREIALETSPTSNLQTGAIAAWGTDILDHPFDLLYQLGFRVTVNTDNRLMSGTTLTRELSILADAFAYDRTDLEIFQLNAAAGAFLPLEEREELADIITAGFEGS